MVTVAWTNAADSERTLDNPNAQLSIGLYHPVATGSCPSTGGRPDPVAPQVTLTDTDGVSYCLQLDQSAGGSSSVSAQGKLFLTREIEQGYLLPSLADSAAPGSLPACTTTAVPWCQPGTVTGPTAALYLIASVTTPKGIPPGAQEQLSSLQFYLSARAA